MTDLVTLGFRADTSGLMSAERGLDRVAAAGGRVDRQIGSAIKSIGAFAAGFASIATLSAASDTIFKFDLALKGLNATTRASTYDMERFESQARRLGAVSKFSATEAAQAQRFLAMAGFETNAILSATPSILKLATAGELSLASAADIASNALGGLQLPVDQLNRVIDVMAETAASANTDIAQLAQALKTAAPIATAAGVQIEELAAVIGALSDSGIQAERAGTGVLGIIRQLSNITPNAQKALAKYGLTTEDLSIQTYGLTGVMKTLNTVNLSAGDAIQVFGSEAATAGLITAAFSDRISKMTERYKNASGSAQEMSNILAGSLTAGLLGLGSALSESALQIGDAGLAGGMKEAMLATTGFVHVFTGMLPEFAEANNLTAEYVSQLNDVADASLFVAGSLGGMLALMTTTKIATMSAAGAMGVLNAVMLANPFVLAATAIAAVGGALYAARNVTVEFGGETVKVRDIVTGSFNAMSDGFDIVQDSAIAAYDVVSQFFFGTTENAAAAANDVANNMGGSFSNIYAQSKQLVNGVIATFITLGKSIGVIAGSITMAFANSFDNVKSLGSALSKDLSAVLEGDFSASNLSETINRVFADPLKMTFSELSNVAAESFNADYIGGAAGKLKDIFFEAKAGIEIYTIAAKNAREENEKLADSSKKLNDDINWMLDTLESMSGKGSVDIKIDTNSVYNDVSSLADSIDNLGGAWSRTGSIVVDTFGTISDALNDYSAKMTEIGKLQSSLDDERQKSGADNAKLDKMQMKLNHERASAEIGNYRNIAGAAESMFSEKTAAAKAFGAINKVLAIAEIAMSYQKIAAGSAATTAHVAQEGTKQGANALTAITGAFAAPFPVNFAMGAAMIGIMAGLLGGSFGGGGASYAMPEEGGTGTVLGDSSAQSESISNAMDNYDDIQIDQLAELRGIRTALSGLSGGIERLASQFSTSLDFGDSGVNLDNSNFLDTGLGSALRKIDPVARVADWIDSITGDLLGLGGIADKIFGGFSSKKQKLIDSGISFVSQTMEDVFDSGQLDADMYQVIETTKKKFWGLSKKTSTNTDTTSISGAINKQMADIFTFVGDSVISATESLGLEASHIIHTGIGSLGLEDALNGFVIDIGNVSFKDKTGEEIQKELEAIFSQQADLMAEYLVPSINEYQKIGEGAFETLQRVAYEQAVFNDSLDRTGMNLSELSKLMQIDVAQSIIGIIGSVEKFSELSNDFFESFYSEAEQLAYLEKSLTDVFSSLGLGLVSNRDEFRALVEGVDLTTAAGQELYATLLQMSPAMSEYLDALEDEQEERKKLRIKFLEDEKSLISATVNDLARLTSSITSELGIAYSIQESLAAARKGDFDFAMRMTNQRVNASGFGNSVDFARAKAIEDNNLYEIAMLAGEQKTELERQIDILNTQIEAIENGTVEQVNAIIDLGATITETGEMIVNRMAGGINSIPEARYSGQELQSNQLKMDIEKQKNEAKKSAEMQERMNLEIIKNTKTTAKILQKIELNGVRILQ